MWYYILYFFLFLVFCKQTSTVAAANPARDKLSERGAGSKGLCLFIFYVGRVEERPDVVPVVLCSRQSSSPVYSRTNTTQRNAAKNAPAMAELQEVIKKFEVVMPQT